MKRFPGIRDDSFGLNVNIRDVTTTDTTSKGDQGIAYTLDGIVIGRPREQGVSFFDVERVEVLRGPQGTLAGPLNFSTPENFNPALLNGSSVAVSEPRTYGMRVGLRF